MNSTGKYCVLISHRESGRVGLLEFLLKLHIFSSAVEGRVSQIRLDVRI